MFLVVQYFLFIGLFLFSLAKSSDSFAMPNDVMLPLQFLSDEGSKKYYSNDWSGSVDMFEKALINYRMRLHVESTCMAKCENATISTHIDLDFSGFDELYHCGNILAQANCVKLCKEEHAFRSVVTELPEMELLEDFERKKPYNFLQYAYYQIGKVKKAAQAAQTYYNANLEDEQALDNLQFYRSMDVLDESVFEDLEAPQFHKLFKEAVRLYEEKNYEEAAFQFERVLIEFSNAVDECRSLCYEPVEHLHFYRFYKATASQLLKMVDCSLECENKSSPVISNQKVNNFLATVFSYLQFSYYSIEKIKLAVPAAAAVLLLNPSDENARHNMEYYHTVEDEYHLSTSVHFQPRQDASDFHHKKEMLEKLLRTSEVDLIDNDEDEIINDSEEESLIPHLAEEVTTVVKEALAETFKLL